MPKLGDEFGAYLRWRRRLAGQGPDSRPLGAVPLEPQWPCATAGVEHGFEA
ncbi:MAG: hypothetical protein M3076_15485 [Actinomycetota bacterium]|nr:hypothetical protein [Actinomycetota bacterium]